MKKEVEDNVNKAQAQLASFEMTETMYMGGVKTARELLGDNELTEKFLEGLGDGGDGRRRT